jgi:urease accessory protein
MIRALGLQVDTITAPFQPEGGAYTGASHAHHDHDHDHDT